MSQEPRRIDVHHHFLPPDFVADLERRGISWTGGAPVPNWRVSTAREVMERNGIATAIASVVPCVYWGDSEFAVHWARQCNEFLARTVADDSSHFGGFATLPLPDTAAACKELEYALDTLRLDGVILFASNGVQYLGAPDFEELFQELERRSTIVFIHPNTLPPGSEVPKLSLPALLVEFVFDTTRSITNLLYSGTFERYPAIRYIVAHAGGAVPYLAWRLSLGQFMPGLGEQVPKGALHYLQHLHFDTALSASDYALRSLIEFVPPSQVLFGSDYPMAPEAVTQVSTAGLEASKVLDEDARRTIYRESALTLFPRFEQAPAGD
jgi:predicted TIM-barrel fold metal-dependent hydrolase